MQVTAEMLREVFRQTQREVLAKEVSFETRWERMAELLNEKLARVNPLVMRLDDGKEGIGVV